MIFVFILLGVLILIFYLYKYKGPGSINNSKKDYGKTNVKGVFSSNKDLKNVEDYVNSALNKGYSKKDIYKALIIKGWTEKQINYVFNKISKRRE